MRDARGGHRENSGRKPKGSANRVTFACRILPDTDAAIRERAIKSGKSQGEILDEIVREGL